jgi:hypothetical protein
MWGTVLFFAALAATDPIRLGIAVLLVSRPRPILNLFAFWLGGMVTSVVAALAVVLVLRDFTMSLSRVVLSAVTNPAVAQIQIAVGLLVLPIAALIASRVSFRQHAAVPELVGAPAGLGVEANTATAMSRLSIRARLDSGSPGVAFVAGLGSATPPVEYLAAIVAILASGAAAGTQISAAMLFTVVAFAVAEIPLVSYLATPGKTQVVMMRVHGWMRARRRPILALIVAAMGIFLVVTGVSNS